MTRSRLVLATALALAACVPTPTATVVPPTAAGVLAPITTPDPAQPLSAAVATQNARVAATLQLTVPILPLEAGLNADQQEAQRLAIADTRFQRDLFDAQTGAALRSEIFGVYPWRESDKTDATAGCLNPSARCFRVEMYNYAYNAATFATVDVAGKAVIAVEYYAATQPDVPADLVKLATDIAVHAPEVTAALGVQPEAAEAMMANTKTALSRTRCERSQHLCVAPTFMAGERALWAIVDLTDFRLVGVRWTNLGQASSAQPVTEKSLQDEVITANYCDRTQNLSQAGWSLDYMLTSSDGLRISNVTYNGKPVLDDAKVVDWHVAYSATEGFGYSDAVGCPVFSQAAVVAARPPAITPIESNGAEIGVSLRQDFWSPSWPAPCNYYYEQRFDFYADGRFRMLAISHGRGCGNDGMYRPVMRLAWAGTTSRFSEWTGSNWKPWDQEAYVLKDNEARTTPEGYEFKIETDGGGYFVEPGRGQFGDGGRGDTPYVFLTRAKTTGEEGGADLPTIGPCCNTDYHQGPEKFIEPQPESLAGGAPLVLWYVPQIKNDDTPGQEYCWAQSSVVNGVFRVTEYPCVAGPMFVPIGAGQ